MNVLKDSTHGTKTLKSVSFLAHVLKHAVNRQTLQILAVVRSQKNVTSVKIMQYVT